VRGITNSHGDVVFFELLWEPRLKRSAHIGVRFACITDVTCGSFFSLPLQENVERAREFVGVGAKTYSCYMY
jgi:hypothetical protein